MNKLEAQGTSPFGGITDAKFGTVRTLGDPQEPPRYVLVNRKLGTLIESEEVPLTPVISTPDRTQMIFEAPVALPFHGEVDPHKKTTTIYTKVERPGAPREAVKLPNTAAYKDVQSKIVKTLVANPRGVAPQAA